jgi:hypothetical protein
MPKMTADQIAKLKAGDKIEQFNLKTNRLCKVTVLWADPKGVLFEWPGDEGRTYKKARDLENGW